VETAGSDEQEERIGQRAGGVVRFVMIADPLNDICDREGFVGGEERWLMFCLPF